MWFWVESVVQRGTWGSQLRGRRSRSERPRAARTFELLKSRTLLNAGGGFTGGGILGQYYNNTGLTGSPAFTRTDVRIDFTNASQALTIAPGGALSNEPAFGVIGSTNFSVKWTGSFIPKYSESYTFKTITDDGVRLYINGSQVINSWTNQPPTTNTYAMTVAAGLTYSIEMDYYTAGGGWNAQLHWSGSGTHPFAEEAIEPATPVGINFTPAGGTGPDAFASGAGATYMPNFSSGPYQLGGNVTSGSNTITGVSGYYFGSVTAGGWINAVGIPAGTTITAVNSSNSTITLSAAATSTVSGGAILADAGPPLDANGRPTANFAMGSFGQGGTGGVYKITFTGSAKLYSNGSDTPGYDGYPDIFLVAYNNGQSFGTMVVNGRVYYEYSPLPLSALQWDPTTGTGYNPSNNTTTVLYYTGTTGWENAGFENTDRSGTGAPGGPGGSPHNNGITNLQILAPTAPNQDLGAVAWYPSGSVFASPFLQMATPYTVLRAYGAPFDPDPTGAAAGTDWNDRVQPDGIWVTSPANLADYGSGDLVPWEYDIMLANETGKDLYVLLPPTATANYITGLANLLKNGDTVGGVTYPGLLPNLNVYVEWSDENWGGLPWSNGDAQQGMRIAQAANNQDWQDYVAMGGSTTNLSSGIQLWVVLRQKDVSDIFRSVYGNAAMPSSQNGVVNADPRIRPLYEWQQGASNFNGGSWTSADAMQAVDQHFGLQANYYLYGGGAAFYADDMDGAGTVNQLFADAPTILSTLMGTSTSYGAIGGGNAGGINLTAQVENDVAICQAFGLHEVGYEGGFDFGGGSATSADDRASLDPRIEGLVQTSLNQYFQGGGALPVVNCATDLYGNQGWGVQNSMWDETAPPGGPSAGYLNADPPKLQAYVNATQALPPNPALPAGWTGTAVGGSGAYGSYDGTNATCDGMANYNSATGAFTLQDYSPGYTGIGSDGWLNYNSDQYYTVTTPVSGNTTITAEVTGQSYGNPALVMRTSVSDSAAPFVAICWSGGYVFMDYRTSDGSAATTGADSVSAPMGMWYRLAETASGANDVFTGYYSTNDTTWTTLGSETISNTSFPTALFTAGLAQQGGGHIFQGWVTFQNVVLSTAPLQAAQVNLMGAYNREGIVTNGTTFSGGGGFDGAGNALSANALGVTSGTAMWNGNAYSIQDYNTDNVVSCDGQTVALPAASLSAISFLAAAVSNQTDQIFTVTYTDGSTQQFIQSFSGWTTPHNYSGESTAVATTYRDTSSGGTTTGTTDVYGYTFNLNPAKLVASITLPVDVSLNLIAADLIPSNANLAGVYNREGIVTDGTTFSSTGGFNAAGTALSANLLGQTVTWNSVPYAIGAANADNVVSCQGQVVALPEGNFSTLSLLAAGVGNQTSQTFTVTYADDTTQSFTQSFSGWTTPQIYGGESAVLAMTHCDRYDGTIQSTTEYIYGYSFAINNAKVVKSITLPNDGNLEILAMGSTPAARTNYRPPYRPLSRPPLSSSPSITEGPLSTSLVIATPSVSGPASPLAAAGSLSSSMLVSTAAATTTPGPATLTPPVSDLAPLVPTPATVAVPAVSRLKSGAKPLMGIKIGLQAALRPAVAWQNACDACFAADGWRP